MKNFWAEKLPTSYDSFGWWDPVDLFFAFCGHLATSQIIPISPSQSLRNFSIETSHDNGKKRDRLKLQPHLKWSSLQLHKGEVDWIPSKIEWDLTNGPLSKLLKLYIYILIDTLAGTDISPSKALLSRWCSFSRLVGYVCCSLEGLYIHNTKWKSIYTSIIHDSLPSTRLQRLARSHTSTLHLCEHCCFVNLWTFPFL